MDDGRIEPTATWGATATGKANLDGATSIQLDDLGQIRILVRAVPSSPQ